MRGWVRARPLRAWLQGPPRDRSGRGVAMKHAVVVRESGEAGPINEGGGHVVSNVLPRLRETAGFLSAVWMTDGSGHTLNVLVFDTEESARAALDPART